MNTPNKAQKNKFAFARSTLNTSIHRLANVKFDLVEFFQYLTPFNEPILSSPSPSSSTVSEDLATAKTSQDLYLKIQEISTV